MVVRSKIILMTADGTMTTTIAAELGVQAATVHRWQERFDRLGLEGLKDAPRPGQPRRYSPGDEQLVLHLLDQPPPPGHAHWNGRLLAKATGLRDGYVWKVLRDRGIRVRWGRSVPDMEKSVLRLLDAPPPPGRARWNGRLLAEAAGLRDRFVWRVLRDHKINLHMRRT